MKRNTELNDLSIAIQEPAETGATLASVSKPWQIDAEASDVLLKALKFGRFRGVVNLFTGATEGAEADASVLVDLVRILIERDILIVVYGPESKALQAAGLLGDAVYEYSSEGLAELCEHVDIQPVTALSVWDDQSGPEAFFDQIAELSSISRVQLPFAALAPRAALATVPQAWYDVVMQLTADAESAADQLDDHIHEKRLALDWSDRYHCSLETYS
jgi:hypothetical protein